MVCNNRNFLHCHFRIHGCCCFGWFNIHTVFI
ncbi:MAG: DUF2759 family protein [Candidatus Hodarchaeota archaeon]